MKEKAATEEFKTFILDQLASINSVRFIRMFGGFGLYQDDIFFAILSGGKLYFKTTPETRSKYEAYGMAAFQPSPKQTLKNYYQVPIDIIEDAQALCEWAKTELRVHRNL